MPIDTGDKLFIHMPKTGGSWVTKYLKEEHGGINIGGHGHQPLCTLKKHLIKDKLIWGTIRDPWSWYLSWWAHGMQARHYQERLAVYGGGSTAFRDVLMGVLSRDPDRTPERVAAIWSLPNEASGRHVYLGGPGGLYTWAYFHMFGANGFSLIDTKRLAEGVQELFKVSVDAEKYPPANTRNYKLPKPAREMYDDEMIDAVYDEDTFLISHLGYESPFSSLPEPLLRL